MHAQDAAIGLSKRNSRHNYMTSLTASLDTWENPSLSPAQHNEVDAKMQELKCRH